jgi:pimeloyl-ACP methyl ester carboxylesterase
MTLILRGGYAAGKDEKEMNEMELWKRNDRITLGIQVGLLALFSLTFMLNLGGYTDAARAAQGPRISHIAIDGAESPVDAFGDSAAPVATIVYPGPGGAYQSLPSVQTLSDQYCAVAYDQPDAELFPRVNIEQVMPGQNLMIVGGYNNNNWEDPSEWMEWIMAYKGWSQIDWDQFYQAWTQADDMLRTQMMANNRIYLFDWTACDCAADLLPFGDTPHQNASRRAHVEEMLGELETQLSELEDVTLIGHSKGGNLVLNYMQRNGKYVRNAVIIDAIWEDSVSMGFARAMPPVLDDTGHPCYENASANIVNIYNSEDWVNSFEEGYHTGNVRNLRVTEPENPHSTKGWLAPYALYRVGIAPR